MSITNQSNTNLNEGYNKQNNKTLNAKGNAGFDAVGHKDVLGVD